MFLCQYYVPRILWQFLPILYDVHIRFGHCRHSEGKSDLIHKTTSQSNSNFREQSNLLFVGCSVFFALLICYKFHPQGDIFLSWSAIAVPCPLSRTLSFHLNTTKILRCQVKILCKFFPITTNLQTVAHSTYHST